MHKHTIYNRMKIAGYSPSGFDYLRLFLALSIMVWHSFYFFYGSYMDELIKGSPLSAFTKFLVPSFFSLSGFLVAGSLNRTDKISSFLLLRCLRIFPALTGETIISAFLIGPLVTALPLAEYFSHVEFRQYFLNIVGDVHFYLPGAFIDNQIKYVNGQLWTIPYELVCYACITVLSFTDLLKRPSFFGLAIILFSLSCYYDDLHLHSSGSFVIVCCFLWGIFLNINQEKVPLNFPLLCLAIISEIIILMSSQSYIAYLAALPIAYITVYLGTLNPKKIFLITKGDYSYGIYLYSAPIQQTIYALLPYKSPWYINLILSIPVTALCAYMSWTFLESKILNQRKYFLGILERVLNRKTGSLMAYDSANPLNLKRQGGT